MGQSPANFSLIIKFQKTIRTCFCLVSKHVPASFLFVSCVALVLLSLSVFVGLQAAFPVVFHIAEVLASLRGGAEEVGSLSGDNWAMVSCTGEARAKQLTLEVRCFVSRYQRSRVFVNGCLIIRDNNNRTETSGKCSSANDLGANTVAPSGGRHRVLSYLGLWRRVVRCCECGGGEQLRRWRHRALEHSLASRASRSLASSRASQPHDSSRITLQVNAIF